MKRVIAILLAVALLLAMTACGGKTESTAESSSPESSSSAAEKAEASKAETESAEPESSSSQEEAAKPVKEEPKEKWVLISEEQTIPHNLLTENEIENMAGRPYRVTKYSYDEQGNVVTEVTEYFCYDTPDLKKTEYLREYDEHGKQTHCKRTFSGTNVNLSVTDDYYQNEYQDEKLIKKTMIENDAVYKITEYEYDDAGRVVIESENDPNIEETVLHTYEYEDDLLVRYIREFMKNDGSVRKVDYEKVNEYDPNKNLVKITETKTYISRSETTVSEREFDDNGNVIKNVSTFTGPADINEKDLYEVWTRRYDADGHSYTQTSYHVTDPESELTSDIIVEEVYYKYLPLSEALAQQDVSEEQNTAPASDAIVFTGPSESTLTHLEQDGYLSRWDFIVPRRYHEVLTFGVKSGRGFITSESGNFNGTVEYGDTFMTIHFDLSDELYNEFGTYDFIFTKVGSAPAAAVETVVYTCKDNSTLTKLSEQDGQSTWELVINLWERDRVYGDTLTLGSDGSVSSETNQYRGTYTKTEDTYVFNFERSEAIFALGPEYEKMEFIRQ